MGKPGWDDSAWTPGRSSRGGRADNGGQMSSSGRDRTGRGDPDPRGYDRSDRRPPRSTNNDAGWDRQRASSSREDVWRGSSGGRPAAGGNRRSSDEQGLYSDFDRSGRNRVPGRDDHATNDSRVGRDYRGGAGRDPRRAGDYNERGQRMPPRGPQQEVWSPPGRGATNVRNRPRPGGSAATAMPGYSTAGRQSLEELRAKRLRQQSGVEEESEEEGGFTASKAFLVILLMLLLGSGGGYAYFKLTTPAVHSNGGTPTGSPAGPSSSSGFEPHWLSTD
jgi:hypothetical protein